MSTNIDYPAMLEDMESKRDSLIASIANLRAFLGLPAQGNGDNPRSPSTSGQSVSVASDLPKGALLNKSIPEAIKLYLKSVAAKRTTREITEALQTHGVESLSSNFSGIVFTALTRLKQSQEVLQFEDGWGLAEFYPAHIRAALTDGPTNKTAKKKKAKGKSKSKNKTPKPAEQAEASNLDTTPKAAEGVKDGVEPRLERFVNELASPVTAAEIAKALNVKVQTAGLLLSKLTHKGRIAKSEDGKFGPKTI